MLCQLYNIYLFSSTSTPDIVIYTIHLSISSPKPAVQCLIVGGRGNVPPPDAFTPPMVPHPLRIRIAEIRKKTSGHIKKSESPLKYPLLNEP